MARIVRGALFVDLDGTVRDTRSGRVHPVRPWDQVVLPNVEPRLRAIRAEGFLVVGVTNQGGVAFGYLTEEDVVAINARLGEELLPGLFDEILYCPHHPNGRVPAYRLDCPDRKPNPGMALQARDRRGIDLATSEMVGDMPADREFAANAGLRRFHWAQEFFGWETDPRRGTRGRPARARR
jgi:D-glycero-D-manno-heptose 1,7-bisphosphate phosphatase